MLTLNTIVVSSMAFAQDDEDLVKQAQQAVASAPPIHIQATIVSIDKASRMVTVRGPHRMATLVVSPDVPNFAQLRVGDKVDVDYRNALLVTAEKVTGKDAGVRKRVDTQTYAPASGADNGEGFDSSRRTEIVATVEHIDRKHRKITLRGPLRTETLDLLPEFESQKLKKGDTVHAVFLSAAAVKVTPAGAAQ
jgi:Cu/Ag efflux protein CusF